MCYSQLSYKAMRLNGDLPSFLDDSPEKDPSIIIIFTKVIFVSVQIVLIQQNLWNNVLINCFYPFNFPVKCFGLFEL